MLEPANLKRMRRSLGGIMLDVGDCDERRFDREILCGSGVSTLLQARVLHERLEYGLDLLSAVQQEGLQGTAYDEGRVAEWRAEIEDVLADIRTALGGKQ
jgi:hypothetical protein